MLFVFGFLYVSLHLSLFIEHEHLKFHQQQQQQHPPTTLPGAAGAVPHIIPKQAGIH